MRFPIIKDIATTSVVSVDVESSISEAIETMLENDHRSIIVVDGYSFKIFSILDLLKVQKNRIDLSLPLSKLDLVEVSKVCLNQNVLETLDHLSDSLEFVCVVNKDKSLYGIVTHTDITSNIDPETLMENYRLVDFLKLNRKFKWVNKDDITEELLDSMSENMFDNVVVVEELKPVGILTTKDIISLVKHKKDLKQPISEYMISPVDTMPKNATIKEALEFIKTKHYKRVVVVDSEGRLSGIITQKELVSLTYSKWVTLMQEHQEELNELNKLLENKNKEYEMMASTDSLTGLYNRYKFSELYLSSYTSMAQRDNNLSLIILDIDHFKNVNDSYGHNNGDQVLIQVSHTLLRTVRNIDIICRWGGEEFVVLVPTADINTAFSIAEKLRKKIEELEIDIVGKITTSFGVSQVRIGDKMEDAIGRADNALYLAKNSGRNCVRTELDL